MPTLSPAPSLTLSPVSTTSDNLIHRPFPYGLLRRSGGVGGYLLLAKTQYSGYNCLHAVSGVGSDGKQHPAAATQFGDRHSNLSRRRPHLYPYDHGPVRSTSSQATEGVLVWERKQGRATLRVEAGRVINPRSGHFEQFGLPYGPKARLLLIHLNSEAVRRQSPRDPGRRHHDGFLSPAHGQHAGRPRTATAEDPAFGAGRGSVPYGYHGQRERFRSTRKSSALSTYGWRRTKASGFFGLPT